MKAAYTSLLFLAQNPNFSPPYNKHLHNKPLTRLDMEPAMDERGVYGVEWDVQNSLEELLAIKEGGFIPTIDDHTELHTRPASVSSWLSSTNSYSKALRERVGTDLIGGFDSPGYGLHIHIDIDRSFAGKENLAAFLCLILKYTPVLKRYSRVDYSFFCPPLTPRQVASVNQFFVDVYPKIEKLEDVMPALRDYIEVHKMTAVNFDHDHFGKKGTIEIRFPQSPRSPKGVYTWISFIDEMVKKSHKDPIPSSFFLKPIDENAPGAVYKILEEVCEGNALLKREVENLIVPSSHRQMSFVQPSPLSLSEKFSWAVKTGDLKSASSCLSKSHSKMLETSVDGLNPHFYPHLFGDKKLGSLLWRHGFKKPPKIAQMISRMASSQDRINYIHIAGKKDLFQLARYEKCPEVLSRVVSKINNPLKLIEIAKIHLADLELVKVIETRLLNPRVLSSLEEKKPEVFKQLVCGSGLAKILQFKAFKGKKRQGVLSLMSLGFVFEKASQLVEAPLAVRYHAAYGIKNLGLFREDAFTYANLTMEQRYITRRLQQEKLDDCVWFAQCLKIKLPTTQQIETFVRYLSDNRDLGNYFLWLIFSELDENGQANLLKAYDLGFSKDAAALFARLSKKERFSVVHKKASTGSYLWELPKKSQKEFLIAKLQARGLDSSTYKRIFLSESEK